jgi:sulfur carrier protein
MRVAPRRCDIIERMITLSVNGQSHTLEPGASLARLLQELDLAGKRVAVEKNGEIVPRSRYPETRLAEGDQLEIVVAVGGG